MRTIKFRGKVIKNQQGNELDWIYGDLVRAIKTNRFYILDLAYFNGMTYLADVLIEVIPDSVGQFTGLKDKNGKEIYEGDILKFRESNARKDTYSLVEWYEESFGFSGHLDYGEVDTDWEYTEVIGNIKENQELLK